MDASRAAVAGALAAVGVTMAYFVSRMDAVVLTIDGLGPARGPQIPSVDPFGVTVASIGATIGLPVAARHATSEVRRQDE